jgi:hypothetical protein
MNQIPLIVLPGKIMTFISTIDVTIPETQTSEAGKLYKGGLADVNSALEESWLQIKEAVQTAAYDGWEAAKAVLQKVNNFIRETAENLGNEAKNFKNRLTEKIQEAMIGTYELVLGSLKAELVVGNKILPIKSIDVEYKMSFSGSLEISLTNLCKMVASGDLVIKGSYGIGE